jgi:hypothetical protein
MWILVLRSQLRYQSLPKPNGIIPIHSCTIWFQYSYLSQHLCKRTHIIRARTRQWLLCTHHLFHCQSNFRCSPATSLTSRHHGDYHLPNGWSSRVVGRIWLLHSGPCHFQSDGCCDMPLHRHRLRGIRSRKSDWQSSHALQSLICRPSSQSWYISPPFTSLIIDSIPWGFLWVQNLSIFHYAFEALLVNEVRYLTLFEEKYGLKIEVPGAAILSIFGFDATAFWHDVNGLSIIFGITDIISS